VLSALALLAVLGAARPASAQFLYDTSINIVGVRVTDLQFTVPAILTSQTTVATFTVATTTDSSGVKDEVLVPTSGGSCPPIPSPCIEVQYNDNSTDELGGIPSFTSPGVYGPTVYSLTITALAPVPEPSSIVLLLTLLGGAALAFWNRLRARSAASPPAES
jgi:hypothetical protein